jgi:hypothetical protein
VRDIRSDLQERANLIEGQIRAVYGNFERMVEQLRKEHDARVVELKMDLAMIAKLMEFEERHLANVSMTAIPPSAPQQADPTQAVKLKRVI